MSLQILSGTDSLVDAKIAGVSARANTSILPKGASCLMNESCDLDNCDDKRCNDDACCHWKKVRLLRTLIGATTAGSPRPFSLQPGPPQ
mmetsp:Transcript_135735/g.378169  ORF Transcript_135735/g.378169 Transcript_135735/m.378169 type:complete len:89 (+) Transcript_135735:493-759(+)